MAPTEGVVAAAAAWPHACMHATSAQGIYPFPAWLAQQQRHRQQQQPVAPLPSACDSAPTLPYTFHMLASGSPARLATSRAHGESRNQKVVRFKKLGYALQHHQQRKQPALARGEECARRSKPRPLARTARRPPPPAQQQQQLPRARARTPYRNNYFARITEGRGATLHGPCVVRRWRSWPP